MNIVTNLNLISPIIAASLINYFIVYVVGALVTFPFYKRIAHDSKLSILFYKLITGSISILVITSVVCTNFRTTSSIILLITALYTIFDRKNFSFSSKNLKPHIFVDFKYFLMSLVIPVLMVFAQTFKFDFFNQTKYTVWGDYSFYNALSTKLISDGIETSDYYGYAGFKIYHYSDLWLSGSFSKISYWIKGQNCYTYIFTSVISSVFFIGAISATKINMKHKPFFTFLFFVSFFTCSIFFINSYHSPKLLLPASVLIITFIQIKNNNHIFALLLSILVVLLHPLLLFITALLIVLIILNGVNAFQKLIQIQEKSILIISITILALCIILKYFFNNTLYVTLISKSIIHELKHVWFKSLLILAIPTFCYKFYTDKLYINSKSMVYIFFFHAIFFVGILISSIPISGVYEIWQFATIAKFVYYAGMYILIFYTLYDISISEKNIVFAIVVLLCFSVFFNLKYYVGFTIGTRQLSNCYSKKLIEGIEKNNTSKNAIVGFYSNYKITDSRNMYIAQRASYNLFLFAAQQAKLINCRITPVFLHNRYDDLSEICRQDWRKTDFYKFRNDNVNKTEELLFDEFVDNQKIKTILTNLQPALLPNYILKKTKSKQTDSISNLTLIVLK